MDKVTIVFVVLTLIVAIASFLALLYIGLKLLKRKENSSSKEIADQIIGLDKSLEGLKSGISARFDSFSMSNKETRELNQAFLKELKEAVEKEINKSGETTKESLKTLEESLNKINERVNQSLKEVREDNEKQLEKIRLTVDEKLQKTLDEKLKQSFDSVSKNLIEVSKKMGEINELTTGVQSLQQTLSGIKSRGSWGEMQLENLIKDILVEGQYEFQSSLGILASNAEKVDAAIMMKNSEGTLQYIPIDAKFPVTDFINMNEAFALNEIEKYKKLQKSLRSTLLAQAKNISSKYIHPPQTTDFAFLFLPTESLYSEVMKVPGLYEEIQEQCRVIVVGPVTLTPMLYSLYQAYKNYQIQAKGDEIQALLEKVSSKFKIFAGNLDKALKQIDTVKNTLVKTKNTGNRISKDLDNFGIIADEDTLLLGINDEDDIQDDIDGED